MNQQPPSHNGQQYNSQQFNGQYTYPPYYAQPNGNNQPPIGQPKQGYGFMIATIILASLLLISIAIHFIVFINNSLSKQGYEAVASINAVKIDEEQLLLSLYNSYPQTVIEEIDYLIRNEVIAQEIYDNNITITYDDLYDELASEKVEYGTEEDFEEYLDYYDMTEEEYVETLWYDAQIRLLLQDRVTVTDDEIQTYYDYNKDYIGISEEKIRASIIVVEKYEQAEQILESLQAGTSFISLAKKYSIDYSAEDGGDLGYISYYYFDEELADAAFSLDINEVSPILTADDGYYIVLKTDYLKAIPADYNKVQKGIEISLINQKINEKYPNYVDQLMEKANIASIIDEFYDSGYFDDDYYDDYEYGNNIFSNPVLK